MLFPPLSFFTQGLNCASLANVRICVWQAGGGKKNPRLSAELYLCLQQGS